MNLMAKRTTYMSLIVTPPSWLCGLMSNKINNNGIFQDAMIKVSHEGIQNFEEKAKKISEVKRLIPTFALVWFLQSYPTRACAARGYVISHGVYNYVYKSALFWNQSFISQNTHLRRSVLTQIGF